MYKIKFGRVLGSVLLGACLLSAGQQQGQAPATNPPPEPPPGAANGPQPGPAVKSPGPGERTGEAATPAPPASHTEEEMARSFLAIGAAPDPAAVKRGQATFVSNCGFCHGSNASGGNTGPDLIHSVLVLHDGGTGKEIGPVVHNGRTGKGMPAFTNFSDAQVKDIAAFLLSRTQGAANRMAYKILNIVTGDPKQGEAYFGAHCANCHSAENDLAHIATRFEPVALQGRFLYPSSEGRRMTAGPPQDPRSQKTVTVKLQSGQSFQGNLDRIDDFSVALTDAAGEHHSWIFDEEKGIEVQVHDPLKTHAELLKQYSDSDMHNILAYLETLK